MKPPPPQLSTKNGTPPDDPGEYINKRRETSGARGYSLDFGSPELNKKFKEMITGAYKNPDGSLQEWGPLNNCAYAFKAAINSIADQLGVKEDRGIKPIEHRRYIERNLFNKFVTVYTDYPYIKGTGARK